MNKIECEVLILGGGCAGLWLQYELCRKGYFVVLVENGILGQYASTRNQGWLQSGALYTLRNTPSAVVEQCKEGYKRITKFDQIHSLNSIDKNSQAIFVFPTPREMEKALERITNAGLQSEPIGNRDFKKIVAVLYGAEKLQSALQTTDVTVDTYLLLRGLVANILECGGRFYLLEDTLVDQIDGHESSMHWEIVIKDCRFLAPIVVCTAGTLIPRVYSKLTAQDFPGIVKKATVFTFHQRLCRRLVVIQDVRMHLLNLSPFSAGTTANMGGLDLEADSACDADVEVGQIQYLQEIITDFLPGFRSWIPCGLTVYICQKLELKQTAIKSQPLGIRHYILEEPRQNLFFLYPGKFTIAPVAAFELTRKLSERLGSPVHKGKTVVHASRPVVAQRSYFGNITHHVLVQSDGIRIIPVAG